MTDKKLIPKAGEYWIKNDGVVRIEDASENEKRGWIYSINYVQVLEDGSVIPGGSSFWWEASDFRPIILPIDILAAKADQANRDIIMHDSEARKSRDDYRIAIEAIKAIKASSKRTP